MPFLNPTTPCTDKNAASGAVSPVDGPAGRKAAAPTGGYKDRFWIPRFWDGMAGTAWFPLLLRNRFQVAPRRIVMAVLITSLTPLNAVLWPLQKLLFGRKIARTRIAADPMFVIGHWRSGTTLLHELLVLDPRFTYPNTYDCFAPNHFLASGCFLRPALSGLLPKQRPMDNMAAGWDCPQEDEFALCNMGIPTPYLTIAFSNRPPQYQEYFDLERVSPRQLARWKSGLLWFLTCITLRTPKRIVLKSPPHTFRVKVLLEMFPRARFIHIVRNPYVIFPSTVNLWKRLYRNEGFQVPKFEGLEERVLATFEQMYEVFERQKQLIPPGQLCEVRYEDLVADPTGQMRAIYDRLGLGEFEAVRPAIEAYFAEKADYQTNRYQLSPELRREVTRRWAPYLRRYGYAEEGSQC